MTTELARQVGEQLRQVGKTLAVAESCSGGLIGHSLTDIPGSSDYFIGGVIAYSNQVKSNLLKVSTRTLNQHGAVSQETAEEMADGVRQLLNTDLALSVTGIAGPTGGTPEKPVGLTWIGLAAADHLKAESFLFEGARSEVKEQAAATAMTLLLTYLGHFNG